MKLLVAATTLLALGSAVAFQKQVGPPGFKPNNHPTIPETRREPPWSLSKLDQTRSDFSAARKEVEAVTGVIIGDSFLGPDRSNQAYAAFLKSKRQTDAFKAIYWWIASGNNERLDKYEALWQVLPKDEYEVARLHFMWGAGRGVYILAPLGDRLLAKNPKDAEVLYVMAFLRSFFVPERNLAKAETYAEAALKAQPGPATHLRYGMVKYFQTMQSRSPRDGKAARKYIDMYLGASNPKDSLRRHLAEVWMTWLKKNGY